jgi:hypothetical protein
VQIGDKKAEAALGVPTRGTTAPAPGASTRWRDRPLHDAVPEPGSLTDEEAQQVAAYINSKPRPNYPFKDATTSARRFRSTPSTTAQRVTSQRDRRPMKRAHVVALVAAASAVARSARRSSAPRRRSATGRSARTRLRRRLPVLPDHVPQCLGRRRRRLGVDYPRADQNLSFRFSELTTTSVSATARATSTCFLIRLTDEETLAHCPVHHDHGAGRHLPRQGRSDRRCGTYLQKGGFCWADDFWGEYAWEHWMNEIRKALPSAQYPVADVPLDDALFTCSTTCARSRRSRRSAPGAAGRAHLGAARQPDAARARDHRSDGHVLVIKTHNTDFGDAFEREGFSRAYFDTFAGPGYAFGINALLYAMTH